MLCDGHKLHCGVACSLDAGQHVLGELRVAVVLRCVCMCVCVCVYVCMCVCVCVCVCACVCM